jgi:hypothetical protein
MTRAQTSEPTPILYGVNIYTYHPARFKNFQFFNARFKANASDILYEESQI